MFVREITRKKACNYTPPPVCYLQKALAINVPLHPGPRCIVYGLVAPLQDVHLPYHVCAFGKLSVFADSTTWMVNRRGPTAPVDPAIKGGRIINATFTTSLLTSKWRLQQPSQAPLGGTSVKCLEYRGGLISGVILYYEAAIRVLSMLH